MISDFVVRFGVLSFVTSGLALIPANTWAEEEVRIAISDGESQLSIEGDDLNIFDGQVGDRLASAVGNTKLKLHAKDGLVHVFGSKLNIDKEKKIEEKQEEAEESEDRDRRWRNATEADFWGCSAGQQAH